MMVHYNLSIKLALANFNTTFDDFFSIFDSSRFVWFFSGLAQAVNDFNASSVQKRVSEHKIRFLFEREERFRHLLKSISFGFSASNYSF